MYLFTAQSGEPYAKSTQPGTTYLRRHAPTPVWEYGVPPGQLDSVPNEADVEAHFLARWGANIQGLDHILEIFALLKCIVHIHPINCQTREFPVLDVLQQKANPALNLGSVRALHHE